MSAAEQSASNVAEASRRKVLAWDLPTRLFKWALVLAVLMAWISSSFSDPAMTVHKAAGSTILTLIVYRVLWGFVGGSTARFSNFLKSPAAIKAYLESVQKGVDRPYLGHNPAGGLMIAGLLGACAVQAGLGLFASDGVLAHGPFADLIGDDWPARAATLHSLWFYVILGLAAVHIGVNLYHQFVKRDDLISAMVTGRKAQNRFVDAASTQPGSLVVALTCLILAVCSVGGGILLAGGHPFGD